MAVKYSASDKEVFIQILGSYGIIEDKRADAYNIEKKKKAWEKIALEYNNSVTEKRTVVQLKRLWDKMKRSRKSELAEERREMMATGGGPSKPSPTPIPGIDNLLPYLEYEVDNEDDSDGIHLNRNASVAHVTEDTDPDPDIQTQARSTTPITPGAVEDIRPSSILQLVENPVKDTPTRSKTIPTTNKNHLQKITEARLLLIKKEEQQLDELHKVRMEEANYRKEAARLVMLQEEAKLKKMLNDI